MESIKEIASLLGESIWNGAEFGFGIFGFSETVLAVFGTYLHIRKKRRKRNAKIPAWEKRWLDNGWEEAMKRWSFGLAVALFIFSTAFVGPINRIREAEERAARAEHSLSNRVAMESQKRHVTETNWLETVDTKRLDAALLQLSSRSNELVEARGRIAVLERNAQSPNGNLLSTNATVLNEAANRIVPKIRLSGIGSVRINATSNQKRVTTICARLKQIFEFCNVNTIYSGASMSFADVLQEGVIIKCRTPPSPAVKEVLKQIYEEISEEQNIQVVEDLDVDLYIDVWPRG